MIVASVGARCTMFVLLERIQSPGSMFASNVYEYFLIQQKKKKKKKRERKSWLAISQFNRCIAQQFTQNTVEENITGSFYCTICKVYHHWHHSRHSPHEIEIASVLDDFDDLTLVK